MVTHVHRVTRIFVSLLNLKICSSVILIAASVGVFFHEFALITALGCHVCVASYGSAEMVTETENRLSMSTSPCEHESCTRALNLLKV